jgi:hypothetical protein
LSTIQPILAKWVAIFEQWWSTIQPILAKWVTSYV